MRGEGEGGWRKEGIGICAMVAIYINGKREEVGSRIVMIKILLCTHCV